MSLVREKQHVQPADVITPSQLRRVMFMPASHMPTLASSIAVNVRVTDRCSDTNTCTHAQPPRQHMVCWTRGVVRLALQRRDATKRQHGPRSLGGPMWGAAGWAWAPLRMHMLPQAPPPHRYCGQPPIQKPSHRPPPHSARKQRIGGSLSRNGGALNGDTISVRALAMQKR